MKNFDPNFHKSRVFANKLNYIDLKTLNQKDKEDLLVKECIYIKVDYWHSQKTLEKYKKENKLFEAFHEVNPKLYEEIINDFNNKVYYHHGIDIFSFTHKLKLKLKIALHKEHKIEIIEKTYKKIHKKINKIPTYFWYCLEKKDLEEYGFNNFNDYISSEINEDFINDYITDEFVNYYDSKIFNEIIQINNLEKQLKFCKNELLKLGKNILDDDSNSLNNEPSKYPKVFPNKHKEMFFFNFLKTYNAIDEDNQPTRRFQTHCDAYYDTVIKLELKKNPALLVRGLTKIEFIEMLNTEFNKNIKKLSMGTKYTDKAEYFINNLMGIKRTN